MTPGNGLGYKPGSSRSSACDRLLAVPAGRRASTLAQTLEDASHVRWSVEDPEGWIQLNREIVEAASQAQDTGLLFRGVKGVATGFLEIGDRDAAEREFEHCASLATEAPAPFLRGVRALQRGTLALLDGQYDLGEVHALEAAGVGLPSVAPLAAVQLYYHRLETGRIAELEASVRSTVESAPAIGAWRYTLARLLSALGRNEEAVEQLDRAVPLEEMGRDRFWLPSAVLGAEVIAEVGDTARAQALGRLLEPHARVSVAVGHGALYYGPTSYFLGLLAIARGAFDEAQQLLDSALDACRKMRSKPWQLRVQLALLENASFRGEDVAEQAGRLLEEAASLGMRRLADRAERFRPG